MKNLYFILSILLCCFSTGSNAQKFENSYSLPGSEAGNDVAELSDGTIITTGNSNSFGAGGYDLMVMKSSKSGELLWVKYLGGTGDDMGNAIAIGSNNEIYCAGYTTVGTNKEGYLVKLDANGNILWTRNFGGAGSDEFKDIAFKSGKIYAIGNTGSAGAGGQDIWFLKTDTAGVIIQNKTLGFAADENANGLTLTTDGNIVVAGRTSSFVGYNVFVAKFNLSGDSLWTRKYNYYLNGGSSTVAAGKGVAELTNQHLLICGIGWDGIGNYSSTFHLRLDANGNTIYSKWTSLLSDQGADVLAGKNGSYYLLINSCNYGCPIVLKKYDLSGTETLYKIFQYAGGLSYANFALPGRLGAAAGSKILMTGSSYLREYNADLYLARIDTNGIAYTTAAPSITASGPTSFCDGGSVTLTVPTGYARYSWGRTLSSNIAYLGVNSNSLVVKTSGYYFCTLWNAKGMRTTAMVIVTVTPVPSGNLTATGALNFCAAAGETLTLTAQTGYTSYQWYKDGTVIPGAISNTYSPSVSGAYFVSITNSCATITSALKAVNVNYITAPVISCTTFDCFAGGSTNCYGPPGSLSVQVIAGATYSWNVFNSVVQSGSSNFLNAPYPPGDYVVTASNACGSSTSTPYLITTSVPNNFAGTAISYNVPVNGCGVGSAVQIFAPTQGVSGSYNWYLNGILIQGSNSSLHTANQSGYYSVEFLDVACGTITQTAPLSVTLNTMSPTLSTPSGNTNCVGAVQIGAQPTGAGITYTWYRENVLLSSGSASTYSATISGSYTCLVNNPACGTKMSPPILVNAGAPVGTANLQNASICSGTSTTVSCVPALGANYTYQWKLNNVNIAGAINYYYTATLAGSYTCAITNACSTITTNAVSLSVLPSPAASITPPLSNVICTPASVLLSANSVPNATYQWFRSGSSVANATQPTLAATSAGTYSVSITANGCSSTSASVVMTSSSGPSSLVTTNKYPLVCSGDTVTLKSPSAASSSWQWRKDNINIGGATDSIYKAFASGVYTVSVTNACASTVSSPLEVAVKSKPGAVITPSGPTTFCSGDSVILQGSTGNFYTYYWKQNNSVIANALSSSYTAKQAGVYKVGIYNKYGCLKESSGLTVTVPCREGGGLTTDLAEDVMVSPNPSSGIFHLNWKGAVQDLNIQLMCYDMQGRIIELEKAATDQLQFQLLNATPGIYFLQINFNSKTMIRKIIKM